MPYELIIIPLIAGLITQGLKLATDKIKGNFDLKNLLSDYGGMPSSHTAFVISLLTITGLKEGIRSTYFAIVFMIAFIVIRDAVGLRRQIGQQGQAINQIIQKNSLKLSPMADKVGHRWLEVFIGGLLGLAIALIYQYFSC